MVQRAGLHGRVGEWERTRELLEGVALTAEVAPRTRCLLHLNLGLTYQFLGRYHESDVRLRRAHQDAVAHGFTDLAVAAIHNRGRLQMLLGNLPGALALMTEAREVADDAAPGGYPPSGTSTRLASWQRSGWSTRRSRPSRRASEPRGRGASPHDVAEADLERARLALLRHDHAEARRHAARAERRFARGSEPAWAVRASLLRLQAELLLGRNTKATATALSALADGPALPAPWARKRQSWQRRPTPSSGGSTWPANTWPDRTYAAPRPSPFGSSERWRWRRLHAAEGRPDLVGVSCDVGRTGSR